MRDDPHEPKALTHSDAQWHEPGRGTVATNISRPPYPQLDKTTLPFYIHTYAHIHTHTPAAVDYERHELEAILMTHAQSLRGLPWE